MCYFTVAYHYQKSLLTENRVCLSTYDFLTFLNTSISVTLVGGGCIMLYAVDCMCMLCCGLHVHVMLWPACICYVVACMCMLYCGMHVYVVDLHSVKQPAPFYMSTLRLYEAGTEEMQSFDLPRQISYNNNTYTTEHQNILKRTIAWAWSVPLRLIHIYFKKRGHIVSKFSIKWIYFYVYLL